MLAKAVDFPGLPAFLIKKMTENRKIPSEKDILFRLTSGQLELPPLTLRPISAEPNREVDMIVQATWKGQQATFAVECKAFSTPRALRDAVAQAKAYAQREKLEPMIIVPFLSNDRLDELESEGISGIDLSGNGIVVAPGKFSVYRTGAPNRFRTSAPIKNIYQKNSSIVGRVFLARSRYGGVTEIRSEIQRRSGPVWPPISLATVSKALKGLEDDLIVSRGDAGISLAKDRPPFRAKVPAEGKELFELLLRTADELKAPIVATGNGSATQYAVMQRGPILSVYCPEPETLFKRLGGTATDRFPNVEIIEANEPFLYFDAREDRGFRWASPVQVYLELMAGDKRDRETAEQVREFILKDVRRQLE